MSATKPLQAEPSERIAVLIDGENTQAALAERILEAIRGYGKITVCKLYGDFSQPNMKPWRNLINAHAIQTSHQNRAVPGKNATDIALTADAIELLLGDGNLSGFCIVSSDSDFTSLALRIRQKERWVIGVGRKQTPTAFVEACNHFIFVETLSEKPAVPVVVPAKAVSKQAQTPKTPSHPPLPEQLLIEAYRMLLSTGNQITVGLMGHALHQIDPAFNPKTYGFSQLSKLLRAIPHLFTFAPDGEHFRLIDSADQGAMSYNPYQ